MITAPVKRLALILTFILTATVISATAPTPAYAASGISIPASGGGSGLTFTGTFLVQKFVSSGGVLNAVGTLTGTATDTAGHVTGFVKNLKVPVHIGATSCDILHLELGPISLDLLGLQVDLNKIVLDIDAQSGAGNLLGNLLCAVAGLLDNPTGLSKLLNDILSLLG